MEAIETVGVAPDDPRFDELASRLPELAGFYGMMRGMTQAEGG
jgi:hypothetical protein